MGDGWCCCLVREHAPQAVSVARVLALGLGLGRNSEMMDVTRLGLSEVSRFVVAWNAAAGLSVDDAADFVGWILDEYRDDRDGFMLGNLSSMACRWRASQTVGA